jgi:hypothetical protein
MKVNIHTSLAATNQRIAELNDALGVRRVATIPYSDEGNMADHIKAVDAVLEQHGGITQNLLSSYHHEGKGGWGTSEGETVAHPVYKLHSTLIPHDHFEPAIKAIGALRTLITKAASVVGDKDPVIVRLRGQLGLLSRSNAHGMNLFDFDSMIHFLALDAVKAIAKAHHKVKVAHAGGPIASLTPARHGMPQPSEEGDEEETEPEENSTAAQVPAGAPNVNAAVNPGAAVTQATPAPQAQ